MLRYEINNDSLFFEIVRDYISSFANSTATGDDFRLIVEKHTGEKYDWFFDQWYYGKGYPVFLSNWRQTGDTLILACSQSSSAEGNEFFRTHLDFRIQYKSGKTENIRILYKEQDHVFRMYASEEILSVQVDPDNNVLKNSFIYKYVDIAKIFTISPNPVNDKLSIEFSNSTRLHEIQLTSISGRNILIQTTSSGKLSLDLSSVPSGIYLLNILEDGKTYTEKIVKF